MRSFDKNRAGLNLGEGAGILIIEREDFYIKRCGKPSLYLSGYGSFADAYHLTAPRPDGTGLESAIRKALSDAGVLPADICFVNAHGTGTLDNDKVEGSVLSRVFGNKIKFLSTKGYTGHTLGGAGGIEAVYTAAALKEGWIPSNAGFECKDDDIPISSCYGEYRYKRLICVVDLSCLRRKQLGNSYRKSIRIFMRGQGFKGSRFRVKRRVKNLICLFPG